VLAFCRAGARATCPRRSCSSVGCRPRTGTLADLVIPQPAGLLLTPPPRCRFRRWKRPARCRYTASKWRGSENGSVGQAAEARGLDPASSYICLAEEVDHVVARHQRSWGEGHCWQKDSMSFDQQREAKHWQECRYGPPSNLAAAGPRIAACLAHRAWA